MTEGSVAPIDVLKLFRQVGQILCQARDLKLVLQDVLECIGSNLGLDRCVIMLLDEPQHNRHVLKREAEFCNPHLTHLGNQCYELHKNSELFALLAEAKPLPLKDIWLSDESGKTNVGELDHFVNGTNSKSLIAFPIVCQAEALGFLSMHYCLESGTFSDEILELGEAITEELALAIARTRALAERELEGGIFRDILLPAFIVERDFFKIRKLNAQAEKLLSGGREFIGLPLIQVMPAAQQIIDGSRHLKKDTPSIIVQDMVAGVMQEKTLIADALVTPLSEEQESDLLVLLCPKDMLGADDESISTSARSSNKKASGQDLVHALSRQLSWERWVRQIICQIHASLDRDMLLQMVVDGLGRALSANRCLLIRTDGPQSLMVTHEYAEPAISPLGLGRTGQFPSSIVAYFQRKAKAVPDVSVLEKSGVLPYEDLETLHENGIHSMAGVPVSHHGTTYGVIILLESGSARQWAQHEIEMLEIAAYQTAIALGHSQSYQQVKDQLFNMNLLSNLTQQLTNTLELASKTVKTDGGDEKARTTHPVPPLSLRELEVLKLITAGLANREIAQRLFLTESTVELHASRIRKKLKLKSRTALVKYACDNGLA